MICTVGRVCVCVCVCVCGYVCEWLGGGYVSINIVLMMSLSDYQHLNHTLHIAVKCTEITLVLGTEPSWYNYCVVSHFCEAFVSITAEKNSLSHLE